MTISLEPSVTPGPVFPQLDRRFEAVVFDWDGTAVRDRSQDATRVREIVEALCAAGMDVYVVTGTHVGNVDGQLRARPVGPGRLRLCMNRGSEVFAADAGGVRLVSRRTATAAEEDALDAAAALTVERLASRGLPAEIVSQRLNRRKIDIIPLPEWADPPKARIDALLRAVQRRLLSTGIASLTEVVEIAVAAAAEAGVPQPRVTSDVKHVEIGLTDKADSARWILADLWSRGVGADAVLVAGDEVGPLGGLAGSDSLMLVPEASGCVAVSVGVEPMGVPEGVLHLGGGPDRFLGLLEDQMLRRHRLETPLASSVPGWTLRVEGLDPALERRNAALLALADGRIGTTGNAFGDGAAVVRRTLAAGVYDSEGAEQELLACPVWHGLATELDPGAALTRTLDMRAGLVAYELQTPRGPVRAALLCSLRRPGTAALRAHGPADELHPGRPLTPAAGQDAAAGGRWGNAEWLRASGTHGDVVAAAEQRRLDTDGSTAVERIACYHTETTGPADPAGALEGLGKATAAGYERLLSEHREAWAERWEDADIEIVGDDDLQLGVRFGLFHLMASVADRGESALGARGMTGPAYRGHVFWDADVFTLPFLAATHPPAARAMLEYRVRRLPAAIALAKAEHRRGARFPWESAATGEDVTPTSGPDQSGKVLAIRTGYSEEHVVADVAWAAACYTDWTGDDAFASGAGRRLLVETARYWASRVRLERDGSGHILGVIGPDEYHEPVDDNAFTNVMARWNLRRAAAAAHGDPDVSGAERARWLALAEAIVDGYDPDTGIYEQFSGFRRLEDLVIADVVPRRPVAADLLLGRDRVRGARVLKQADVLMLHHLLPDETRPGSLQPNLEYYEPRTAHGSSLSPGIHAALLARVGRLEEAIQLLRVSARIDLDDLTGSTSGGVHIATMGSVWHALVFGFAGVRPAGSALRIDPRLPAAWDRLELRLRFRGSRVRIRVEPNVLEVRADPPVRVLVPDAAVEVHPGGLRFDRRSAEPWRDPS